MDIIKAPDFPGGGVIVYDKDQMRSVFETGQGSVRIRSRYVYDKAENCIDIIQIPYSTSIELIIKRITELIKLGKLNKEIADIRAWIRSKCLLIILVFRSPILLKAAQKK